MSYTSYISVIYHNLHTHSASRVSLCKCTRLHYSTLECTRLGCLSSFFYDILSVCACAPLELSYTTVYIGFYVICGSQYTTHYHNLSSKSILISSLPDMRVSGLRRLPALVSQGETISSLAMENFEIVFTEALHDLKNQISLILKILPGQINDQKLSRDVSKFCAALRGEY